MEGLSHGFPTIRGEHINTVKRHMRGYPAQAYTTVANGA